MSPPNPLQIKFQQTIRRWKLLGPKDRLLVAVSGGLDSVTLLHLLLHLPLKSRPTVVVAHFNHRLRKESDQEEKFVQKLCRDWKVPCRIGRAPRWKNKKNLEARARELRYQFLIQCAKRQKIQKILTAHHADDQVETFLIRWLQGAGLKGLSGMPFVRAWNGSKTYLVRPLLLASRKEIEAYARQNHLTHCNDLSNQDLVFFRNRIRRLVKTLAKENPNLQERVAINSLFLRADEEWLRKITEDYFQKKSSGKRRKVELSLKLYRELPDAIRYRLLQRMSQAVTSPSYSLPGEAILKLDELLHNPEGEKRYDLPSGLGFYKKSERFELIKRR